MAAQQGAGADGATPRRSERGSLGGIEPRLGATEVAGTSFLKLSDGFTRLAPSVAVVGCYSLSFVSCSPTCSGLSTSASPMPSGRVWELPW